FRIEDAASALQAHQRTAMAGAGDGELEALAHGVFFLVAVEAEHGCSLAVLPAAASVAGPIEVDLGSSGMAAGGVGQADDEAPPQRTVHAEVETGLAAEVGGDLLLLDHPGAGRGHVVG